MNKYCILLISNERFDPSDEYNNFYSKVKSLGKRIRKSTWNTGELIYLLTELSPKEVFDLLPRNNKFDWMLQDFPDENSEQWDACI